MLPNKALGLKTMTQSQSFICPHCGKEHEGLPTNWGFGQPDEIFALNYLDKYQNVRINDDLATYKESRYFLRGVLSIPFTYQEGYFGWGVWVEVSKKHHELYLKNFYTESSHLPRFKAVIASAVPGYKPTTGLDVEVQLGNAKQRPTFFLPIKSGHVLSKEQLLGIGAERHHEVLEACGYFSE